MLVPSLQPTDAKSLSNQDATNTMLSALFHGKNIADAVKVATELVYSKINKDIVTDPLSRLILLSSEWKWETKHVSKI